METSSRKWVREYSHITRKTTIEWDKSALFTMIMRRILKNEKIKQVYSIEINDDVFQNKKALEILFNKIFPQNIHVTQKTFDWIITRTVDGKKMSYPRNIIQLIKIAKHKQLKAWSNGEYDPSLIRELFDTKYVVEALKDVSQTQVEVLFSEYPQYRQLINQLKKQGPKFTLEELKSIWEVDKLSKTKSLFDQIEKLASLKISGAISNPLR